MFPVLLVVVGAGLVRGTACLDLIFRDWSVIICLLDSKYSVAILINIATLYLDGF